MNTSVNVMMGVSAEAQDSELSSVKCFHSFIYLVTKALFIISKSKQFLPTTDVANTDK